MYWATSGTKHLNPSTRKAEWGELRAILGYIVNSRPYSQTTSQSKNSDQIGSSVKWGPVSSILVNCQDSLVSPSSRKKPCLSQYKKKKKTKTWYLSQAPTCPHTHVPHTGTYIIKRKAKQSSSTEFIISTWSWWTRTNMVFYIVWEDKCQSELCITSITYAQLCQHFWRHAGWSSFRSLAFQNRASLPLKEQGLLLIKIRLSLLNIM